jgi:hypothetical protein
MFLPCSSRRRLFPLPIRRPVSSRLLPQRSLGHTRPQSNPPAAASHATLLFPRRPTHRRRGQTCPPRVCSANRRSLPHSLRFLACLIYPFGARAWDSVQSRSICPYRRRIWPLCCDAARVSAGARERGDGGPGRRSGCRIRREARRGMLPLLLTQPDPSLVGIRFRFVPFLGLRAIRSVFRVWPGN